jgi:hypothetical protein
MKKRRTADIQSLMPRSCALLTLRENTDFSAKQYVELFMELFATIQSPRLVLLSLIVDSLPTQSSGLEHVLYKTHSPVVHIRCLAQMANLIFFHTVPTRNFARAMTILCKIQNLLPRKHAHEAIGDKCLRFTHTCWFYRVFDSPLRICSFSSCEKA